jgi:hypothetical protein
MQFIVVQASRLHFGQASRLYHKIQSEPGRVGPEITAFYTGRKRPG